MRRLLPFLLLALTGLAAWLLIRGGGTVPEVPALPVAAPEAAAPVSAAAPSVSAPEQRRGKVIPSPGFDPRAVKSGSGRHRLQGRVVDEYGQPVPGAWVAAYSAPIPFLDFEFDFEEILKRPLDLSLEPLASAFADQEGGFVLQGAPGRTLYLTARSHRRLTPRRQRVTPAALDRGSVTLRTVAAPDLRGRVVDDRGRAVAHAEVLVGPGIKYLIAAFRNRSFFLERVYTDEEGRFAVEAVPPRQPLTANAFAGPVRSGLAECGPFEAGTTGAVQVELEAVGAISGQVVDSGKRGVSGSTVVAVPLDLRRAIPFVRNPPGWTARSTGEGGYRFAELPIGNYLLLAQGRAGRSAPVSAAVTSMSSVAPPIDIDTKAVVAGRVLDAAGQPVPGAVVSLQSIPAAKEAGKARRDRGGMLAEAAQELLPELLSEGTVAIAGPGGRFRIPAWGRARLRVVAAGYGTSDFELGKLASDKHPVLVLQRTGGLEGLVVDATARAPVEFYVVRGEYSGVADPELGDALAQDEQALFAATTWRGKLKASQVVDSADGRFRLTGIPAGTWVLRVQAAGFADTSVRDLEVRGGAVTRGIIVSLDRGASVAGRVVADGVPVAGAVVTVGKGEESTFLSLLQGISGGLALGETGADGSFLVSGAGEGSDHVNVLADGFAVASQSIEPLKPLEARTGVVLRLSPGGTVQGIVTDRHGLPLPGRMVGSLSMQARDFQQTATNGDGFYRIEHLRPGSYFFLSAALDDESLFTGDFAAMLGSSRLTTAWVAAGEVTRLDIVDEGAGGCRLAGTLLRQGLPVGGAGLSVFSAEEEGLLNFRFSTTRTDEDGRFVFKSLAPGEYGLRVESEAWDGSLEIVVPDLPEDEILLEVPRNVVHGRIVAGFSGDPVAKAAVRLRRQDGRGGNRMIFGGGMDSWIQSGDRGEFRFEGLSPGRYRLEVTPQRMKPGPDAPALPPPLGRYRGAPFAVGASDDQDLGVIALPLAGEILVRAVDAGGQPFQNGFRLKAIPEDPGATDGPSLDGWGRQGEGRVTGLLPGRYRIQATASDRVETEIGGVEVDEGRTTEVEITFSRGVELRARILDADNAPVPAELALIDRDGHVVNKKGGMAAALGRFFRGSGDGAVRVGVYPAGQYTLRATFEGDTREVPVTLIEGQQTLVELRF